LAIDTFEMCRANGYEEDGLYTVPEFTKLLDTLNRRQCRMASRIVYPRDYSLSLKDGDEFDVIVVGSGAAGSVLAARLSDVKDLRVLLVEAGGEPYMESEIPGLLAHSVDTPMNWNYTVRPDETFGQSLDGKRVKVIRGKCLGGNTALNNMLYDRGAETDYAKLVSAGLTKWDYGRVSAYYKRSEDCRFAKMVTNETTAHVRGGVLAVDSFRVKRTADVRRAFATALRSVGSKSLDYFDVNDDNRRGFGSSVATVRDGLRVNAARAFLRNADKKYNLKIAARTVAKRVLFDGTRAAGVQLENSVGQLVRVKCAKLVAVCAGPVGSPALLLGSGVGPKAALDAIGVPTVASNDRVGDNLRARPFFVGLVFKFDTAPVEPCSISEMVFEYLMDHAGPLANIGLSSYTGFVDVDGDGTPDVQIINYYYAEDDTVFMPSQLDAFNYDDDVVDQFIELNDDHEVLIAGVSLLRPCNAGKVVLTGTADGYEPVVEYGSLDERDVGTLLKAVAWIRKLMKSSAFARYGPTVVPLKIRDGPAPDAESDQYWRHAVKHLTTMNVQMAGTNAMAVDGTKGVVNEDLEVFGVDGLMVVDSSALPTLFSAESSAPSMMVAEKAADIIKEKLRCRDDDDDDDDDDDGKDDDDASGDKSE